MSQCGQKGYVLEKSQWHRREKNSQTSCSWRSPSAHCIPRAQSLTRIYQTTRCHLSENFKLIAEVLVQKHSPLRSPIKGLLTGIFYVEYFEWGSRCTPVFQFRIPWSTFVHTDVRDIIPRRGNAYLLTGRKRNINSAQQTCKTLCQAVKTLWKLVKRHRIMSRKKCGVNVLLISQWTHPTAPKKVSIIEHRLLLSVSFDWRHDVPQLI